MAYPIVERARAFAIAAHEAIGQTRKYTGEPYWRHPEQVAFIVAHVLNEPEAIAAAWIHDVLEDTKVRPETIWHEFGAAVGILSSS